MSSFKGAGNAQATGSQQVSGGYDVEAGNYSINNAGA